jgi:hypothetical protein
MASGKESGADSVVSQDPLSRVEGVTISSAQATTVAPEQGFWLMYCLTSSYRTLSQGVARRRDASRVPRMCPECVRVFGW